MRTGNSSGRDGTAGGRRAPIGPLTPPDRLGPRNSSADSGGRVPGGPAVRGPAVRAAVAGAAAGGAVVAIGVEAAVSTPVAGRQAAHPAVGRGAVLAAGAVAVGHAGGRAGVRGGRAGGRLGHGEQRRDAGGTGP